MLASSAQVNDVIVAIIAFSLPLAQTLAAIGPYLFVVSGLTGEPVLKVAAKAVP